ncbi:hypothetical protein ANANG_G00217350 [Anguilla anguilla]|uniref:cAMP-dependent protein kinase type II-alpha regulatory subunit n=1 Tax=Anguilla anguilla TaxID=7936 RepID=A0A9D3LVK4_ANGAN|nr:hypothetical protein ANANG_G00217350 [Anguilla anguilla]
MFELRVQPQQHVIDQGDDGDNFYVIERGVYDIVVRGCCVGQYDNKGSFGELALMYNTPEPRPSPPPPRGRCGAWTGPRSAG